MTGLHKELEIINLLFDAGAIMDHYRSLCDYFLVVACAVARLSAFPLLIAGDVEITLLRDGQIIGALHAARSLPDIVHWLLVWRVNEGPGFLMESLGSS